MAYNKNLPKIRYNRSVQDLSYGYKTTFNEGDLIPCYIQEVFPGDNHQVESRFVIRTTSPFIRPIMDNLFIDFHYFFVPNRLVFDKWREFMGENTDSYWTQSENITIPQTFSNDGASGIIRPGTIADYFGVNTGTIDRDGLRTSLLPFRAFALIYNEWYRDENLQEPVLISTGIANEKGDETLNNKPFSVSNYTGKVPKACKIRDYFTSCLPEPQKGVAVSIPTSSNMLPVIPNATDWGFDIIKRFNTPTHLLASNGSRFTGFLGVSDDGSTSDLVSFASTGNPLDSPYFSNLGADTTNLMGTINDLRFATQLQKYLEKDARYGTRYIEYLYGHWGITSSDKTLQRPQYLGGKRTILNLTQVTQTSQSTEASPLAQVSAYSLTNGKQGFSMAFEEHGFVIGVACVRHKHSYQQGCPKFFNQRVDKLDFYDPLFANLGEQPVYTKELYSNTGDLNPEQVFGYNEAFADLRQRQSIITGELKTSANKSLDVWHMADTYSAPPTLSADWIQETGAYLDRCLSVPSSTMPNFIADFYHSNRSVRVMPTYSIPGLMDHN